MTFLPFEMLCLRIGDMVPVTWIVLFVGRLLPITLERRRPNSFPFTRFLKLASGPCSKILRNSCLPDSGVVVRAAMWRVYFSWKADCAR